MNTRTNPDERRAAGMTFLCALALALLLDGAGAGASEGYAIVDVTVVPMDREAVLPAQTVIVKEGRIAAVGSASETAVPEGFERIDGTNRFLAPGLADMHAHPMTPRDLDLYIAAGVTSIRAMWGEPEVLRMRAEVEAGERVGPRILTGGRIVDGEPVIHYGTEKVLTREDGERVVREQHAAGYDFIKIYSNLSLEAFDAIAEVAQAVGIPYAGHIPTTVPMEHALRSGMLTSEHLLGIAGATLAEGKSEVSRFGPDFQPFAEQIGTGELKLEEQYDEQKLVRLAQLAARTGHWLVPTLIVLRGTSLDPQEIAVEWKRREMLYTDFTVRRFWRRFASFGLPKSEAFYRGVDRLFDHNLHQVKVFHDAGARLLAGTDAPNAFVYVGFSLVDELELFVDAGLRPFEALKTATVNPGNFLGESGLTGIIAEGARADIALLDTNPLEDVGAYRTLRGLFVNGHWLDRNELDRRLAEVMANNERKAALFGDQPAWLLNENEVVPLTAGFIMESGGAVAGTERIGRVQAGETVTAVLAEQRGADGGVTTWRLENDEKGRATRLSVSDGTGESANTVAFVRDGDGFTVQRADGTTARFESLAERILTGTAADALSLRALFDSMTDGETRKIDALCLHAGSEPEPCAVKVLRNPAEVIVGHFYFSGVNRYDLAVETASHTRVSRIWMGGGFYAGWPIRLELDAPPAETTLAYRRLL